MFNHSLQSGVFPTRWKASYIRPIHKKGDRSIIENYRGIAILSAIPKLLDKIMADRLASQMVTIISDNQHGFMRGRSSATNLLLFSNFLINGIESGHQIDAAFTDFSKAFDRVNIDILCKKLIKIGFDVHFVDWIRSYLSGRTQFVKFFGFCSEFFSVTSGVPQGSHLGPLLFILFLNDIYSVTDVDTLFLSYADDCKVARVIKNVHDFVILQRDINSINNWCIDNHLLLNIQKCNCMTFSRKSFPFIYNYSIGNIELARISEYVDLGVKFDQTVTFNSHINMIVSKSNKTLGFIKRNTKDFNDPYALKLLFTSFIRSILEYCSVVWNPFYRVHIDRLEGVQRRFTRYALSKMPWSDGLPSFQIRNRCLCLNSLLQRRNISCAIFTHDVISGRINCSPLLSKLNFSVPNRSLRHYHLLNLAFHRTNYGMHEPINDMCRTFNEFYSLYDFGVSRDNFRKSIICHYDGLPLHNS